MLLVMNQNTQKRTKTNKQTNQNKEQEHRQGTTWRTWAQEAKRAFIWVASEADPGPSSGGQAIYEDLQRTGVGERARDMGSEGNQ